MPVDVTVPNATLTGMRTYIQGSPRQSEFAAPEWNGERDPRHDTIDVTHDMEWDTDSVSLMIIRAMLKLTYDAGISGSVFGGEPCLMILH